MRKICNAGEAKTASPDEIKAAKAKTLEAMSIARSRIFTAYPFIGAIAMSLELVPVRDIRVPTMCTDGASIYADCDFTLGLTPQEQLFVVGHEVWHACLAHLKRRGTRDPEIFNIATDMEVNRLLKCDGFEGLDDMLMPTDEMAGKNAEDIYEILISSKDSENLLNASKPGSGKMLKQFDKHLYDGDEDSSEEQKKQIVADSYGQVGLDPDFKPSIPKDLVDKMREQIVSAVQQAAKSGRGTLPSHIAQIVDAYMKPEINWKEELSKFVSKCAGGDRRSWLPPNRRYVYGGFYLPSRRGEQLKVAAILDTSGSTAGDMQKFVSELNALVSGYGRFELTLVQCDACVQSAQTYTDENPFFSQRFEVSGGGGTRLVPAFEWLEDAKVGADCIVVFTDGYTERFSAELAPAVPVLWIVTKNGTFENIEFGKKIKFANS